MRLTDLEPQFMKRLSDTEFLYVDSIAEADILKFLCPACWTKNKGPIGTHAIMCPSPSVPKSTLPNMGRWNLVGTGFQDLSLVAGSSSILVKATEAERAAGIAEHWHGFIRNGEVTL
jgi:hypothetical protein